MARGGSSRQFVASAQLIYTIAPHSRSSRQVVPAALGKIGVQILSDALRFIVPVLVSVIGAVIAFGVALWERLGPSILQIVDFIRVHWSQIAF